MEFEPKTAMTTPMPVWHRNSKKTKQKIKQEFKKKIKQEFKQKSKKSKIRFSSKSKIKNKIKKIIVFFDCNQNPMLRVAK